VGYYNLPIDIDLNRFKTAFETVHRENHNFRTRKTYLELYSTVQVVPKVELSWEYARDIDQVLEAEYSFSLGTSLFESHFAIQVVILEDGRLL
jgi:hypothetical protein